MGTWESKDLVYCFAAVNVVSGQLTTRLVEQGKRRQGAGAPSQTACLQRAFAAPLRDIARASPASPCPEVILTIDNAPWHRGAAVTEVLAAHPHVRLYRLPSYSPQLNVIERFWRQLRRRATHNRLFASMAALRKTLRQNLCYFQTMRHKVLSLREGPRKKKQI